jgi:hypothetical protein
MGWIKDAKAAAIAQEAKKAWDAGSQVFTPLLNMPATHGGLSGRIEDWEKMMAAVLEIGWKLHTWAVCSDSNGRPQAQPLFVRT